MFLQDCQASSVQKHKERSLSKFRNVRIGVERHIDAIQGSIEQSLIG